MADWKMEAEQEIHLRFSFPGRVVPTDAIVNGDIAAIIGKHCPFKDGVAYTSVPRCKTCKHWERHPDNAYPGGPTGSCHVLKIDRSYMPFYTTGETFGCVRWNGTIPTIDISIHHKGCKLHPSALPNADARCTCGVV